MTDDRLREAAQEAASRIDGLCEYCEDRVMSEPIIEDGIDLGSRDVPCLDSHHDIADALRAALAPSAPLTYEQARENAADIDDLFGLTEDQRRAAAERDVARRAALAQPAPAAPLPRCPDCDHEWRDHGPSGCEVRYPAKMPVSGPGDDGERICVCTEPGPQYRQVPASLPPLGPWLEHKANCATTWGGSPMGAAPECNCGLAAALRRSEEVAGG